MSIEMIEKRKALLDELSKIEGELETEKASVEKQLSDVNVAIAKLQEKIDAATAPFKKEWDTLQGRKKTLDEALGSMGLRRKRRVGAGAAPGEPRAQGVSGRAMAIKEFLKKGAATRQEIYGAVGESGWTGMELAALIRKGDITQGDDGKFRLT